MATFLPESPYGPDVEAEHRCWDEITDLCRSLDPRDRERPGYYANPDWSVKDLVAHLGMWFATAHVQLERIRAGTYEEQPIDVDARNAEALEALRAQDWSTIWSQAHSARVLMLSAWAQMERRTDAADWWVHKAGAEHEMQHVGRLREWASQLLGSAAPA